MLTLHKYWQSLNQKRAPNTLEITIFLRQLATLMTAGIPIIQCCEVLEKSQEKIALRVLILSIKRDVLSGKTLFHSLKKHPHYFDELTCQLVQIGEHTGKLDALLQTIANDHEKRWLLKKQIKNALFYPCLIAITGLGVSFGLFIFIVPRFADLFHEVTISLPWFTQCIFYLSSMLNKYLHLFIALIFISLTIGVWVLHKTGKRFTDQLAKLPIIQHYQQKLALARFARNLALTFAAGVPITNALKLTANACTHPIISMLITNLHNKLCTGLSLHRAMESSTYFPNLMIQLVRIGEESGTLDDMLNKTADFFEADVEQLLNQLSQLLEPLLMLLLGVLIGGLVIGMYLPLFKLGSLN